MGEAETLAELKAGFGAMEPILRKCECAWDIFIRGASCGLSMAHEVISKHYELVPKPAGENPDDTHIELTDEPAHLRPDPTPAPPPPNETTTDPGECGCESYWRCPH